MTLTFVLNYFGEQFSSHHQFHGTINNNYNNQNNIIIIQCANAPSVKEPTGQARSDGKRPGGVASCTLIPWSGGKCIMWDGVSGG